MRLFIVGSGRCGTKSVAAAFYLAGIPVGHEDDLEAVLPLQHAYVSGIIDLDTTAEAILNSCDFPPVEASYALTGLVDPLKAAYPDAEFLHVTRDPDKTADSMVRNGWYDPTHDWQWPVMWSWITPRGLWAAGDHPPYRISAPWVGESSWSEWVETPQRGRCLWWIDWTRRRLSGLPSVDIDTGRLVINDVEVEIPHIR